MFFLKKKSQASMEFLILFMLMVLMFSGFMYFAHGMFDRIEQAQVETDADALANDFMMYVVFSLRTDYLKVKNFRLPVDLGGRQYSVSLKHDVRESYVVINLTDSGRLFYHALRKKVNGTLDKSANLEHCITSKNGKALIAPYIMGLEPARINEGSGWREFNGPDFNGGILNIKSGSDFSMYVKGNCLHDFESLEANVRFSDEIDFIKARKSASHQDAGSGSDAQIYGDDFFGADAYANLIYTESPNNVNIEITHISPEIGPVGSDKLVELVFKAGSASSDEVMQIVPYSFKDGLFRDEVPQGEIIEIAIY